jgi:REP element-mobilizing transposase RayT
MPFDPQVHHRRSIRLKGYDYALPGAYFVTMLAYQKKCLFGNILGDKVVFSEIGKKVRDCWLRLPKTFNIRLDEWVIMPNHLHGIIWILDSGMGEATAQTDYHDFKSFPAVASPQQRPIGTKPGSLGAIIQNFKTVSTRKSNQMQGTPGVSIWQRNYFERIIRDEEEWGRIRLYIQENPARWIEDMGKGEASAHNVML